MENNAIRQAKSKLLQFTKDDEVVCFANLYFTYETPDLLIQPKLPYFSGTPREHSVSGSFSGSDIDLDDMKDDFDTDED